MFVFVLLQGEIHRVKSDGTNRTEFAPAAILGSPVGLALDWITENLYYTNPATQSIEVKRIMPCSVKKKTSVAMQLCSTIIAPLCVWQRS